MIDFFLFDAQLKDLLSYSLSIQETQPKESDESWKRVDMPDLYEERRSGNF